MGANENGYCNVSSLSQLRRLRSVNEAARNAALKRVKGGVESIFSIGGILLGAAKRCNWEGVMRYVKFIIPFFRR